MTQLSSYLKKNGIRQADFAATLGTCQAKISRLANGATVPDIKMAFEIERVTGGEVPVSSWLDAERQKEAAE